MSSSSVARKYTEGAPAPSSASEIVSKISNSGFTGDGPEPEEPLVNETVHAMPLNNEDERNFSQNTPAFILQPWNNRLVGKMAEHDSRSILFDLVTLNHRLEQNHRYELKLRREASGLALFHRDPKDKSLLEAAPEYSLPQEVDELAKHLTLFGVFTIKQGVAQKDEMHKVGQWATYHTVSVVGHMFNMTNIWGNLVRGDMIGYAIKKVPTATPQGFYSPNGDQPQGEKSVATPGKFLQMVPMHNPTGRFPFHCSRRDGVPRETDIDFIDLEKRIVPLTAKMHLNANDNHHKSGRINWAVEVTPSADDDDDSEWTLRDYYTQGFYYPLGRVLHSRGAHTTHEFKYAHRSRASDRLVHAQSLTDVFINPTKSVLPH